jgi:hypothetical protein
MMQRKGRKEEGRGRRKRESRVGAKGSKLSH